MMKVGHNSVVRKSSVCVRETRYQEGAIYRDVSRCTTQRRNQNLDLEKVVSRQSKKARLRTITMSGNCAACDEPLLVLVESDSEAEDSKNAAAPETVPDDVELGCGCHFHW